MRFHEVEQGGTDWLFLRAGIPTASEFHRIITPKTGELSKQSKGYQAILLYEWAVGHPFIDESSRWMDRGHELEGQAVKNYEFQTGFETTPGGFFTTDDGLIGASPDRCIDGDGFLEIKCPKPDLHVFYMMNGVVNDDHRPQAQGQLFVGEREWEDIVSHHPELPPVIVRVNRDDKYIDLLEKALNKFVDELLEAREQLNQRCGPLPLVKKEVPISDKDLFLTDEDAADIFAAIEDGRL